MQMISVLVQNVLYFSMLGLGIFFIYEGEVIQRFQLRRTNFAVFEEDLTELPTITTYIYPYIANITYNRDFKIFFRLGNSELTNPTNKKALTLGLNNFRIGFSVNFQHFYEGLSAHSYAPTSFKITPMNYPSNMPVEFSLRYQFENASLIMGSEIWLAFTTENGTASCNGNYYDGKKVHKVANLGEVKALTIAVRKDQHLSSLRKCRKVPYTDMIIEITLRNLYDKCPFPCKPGGVLKFCPE